MTDRLTIVRLASIPHWTALSQNDGAAMVQAGLLVRKSLGAMV